MKIAILLSRLFRMPAIGWLALIALSQPATAAAQEARPNIVFILTDDQRWDALGCMGHPFFKTPNMDRIAKEGALFKNYFVSIPLCSPSRASYLTGQYAHTHGIVDNHDHNAESHNLKTYPQLLQQAGYETAFIGKWHMGDDATPRPGFDKWVCMHGQGEYIDCDLNVDGQEVKPKGYLTDVLTGYAVEFLKKPRQKPFLLYLPHKAPHGPGTAAKRHKKLYAGETIPRAPSVNDDLSGKPALMKNAKLPKAIKEAENPLEDKRVLSQFRTLAAVDEGIGQIFAALEETGQLDNTIIIFTSDNGYFWGEHQLSDKRAAYEESIRDPLLIRYPKLIKPGTVIDQMVLNIDIAPTVLELAGVPAPPSVQGRSFVPLLKGSTEWRTSFLTEYFWENNHPRIPTWQAVRTDRWKLIHYTDTADADELYDLKSDPYEMNNRIADPAAKAEFQRLQEELQSLLKATS